MSPDTSSRTSGRNRCLRAITLVALLPSQLSPLQSVDRAVAGAWSALGRNYSEQWIIGCERSWL
jgi:hypothetical protein